MHLLDSFVYRLRHQISHLQTTSNCRKKIIFYMSIEKYHFLKQRLMFFLNFPTDCTALAGTPFQTHLRSALTPHISNLDLRAHSVYTQHFTITTKTSFIQSNNNCASLDITTSCHSVSPPRVTRHQNSLGMTKEEVVAAAAAAAAAAALSLVVLFIIVVLRL